MTRGRLIQLIAHAFTDLRVLPMHRDLVSKIADNVFNELNPAQRVWDNTYSKPCDAIMLGIEAEAEGRKKFQEKRDFMEVSPDHVLEEP